MRHWQRYRVHFCEREHVSAWPARSGGGGGKHSLKRERLQKKQAPSGSAYLQYKVKSLVRYTIGRGRCPGTPDHGLSGPEGPGKPSRAASQSCLVGFGFGSKEVLSWHDYTMW